MPSPTNPSKSLVHVRRPGKGILNRLSPGRRVRLRDHVHREIREREWILNKIDREGVHLIHESGAYGVIVDVEDIDWSEFRVKSSDKDKPPLTQAKG